MIVLFNIPMI
uniref:Uncharacterized protein n=1 Tax=Arundo donax TaxID=35708 RepID=A0A0A8YQV8_ARUDO